MDNLFRFCLYILAAWTAVCVALVVAGIVVGLLTRPVWRRTQWLIDRVLGERPTDDDADEFLHHLFSDQPTREHRPGDAPTVEIPRIDPPTEGLRELRAHPVNTLRRRRETRYRLSDSYPYRRNHR